MKYISRLTALLTALMLLLSAAAVADTAVSYDEWLAAQQAAKGAYCNDENCTYLYTALHMEDVTEQYEYLNSLASVTVTTETGATYTRLHMVLSHYGFAWGEVIAGTDTAHPFNGTELCTCFADDTTVENYVLYPYGDAKHSDTCAWSGAAIDGESLLAKMLALETAAERQAYSNELYPAEIAAMLAAYRETDTVTQWLADLQAEDPAATIKDAALLYALLAGGTDRIWLDGVNLYGIFNYTHLAVLENGLLIDTRYHIAVAQVDENGNIVPLETASAATTD